MAPYVRAWGFGGVAPARPRKLLLHHRQIAELAQRTQQDSVTLVPLAIYFKEGRAKLELAVARGRRQYDKRAAIAERDADREAARALRSADRDGDRLRPRRRTV